MEQKILYLITKGGLGGAQKYVYDLSTSLPTNCKPLVVTGSDGDLTKRLTDAEIPTHILKNAQRDVNLLKDIALFFELARLIFRAQPDVLHVNSSKIGGLGAFIGRILGVPKIIFTAHGWPFNERHRPWHWRTLAWLFSWLTSFFAHTTIVISNSDLRQGKQFPFISKKMRFIPLGIEAPSFKSRAEALSHLQEHYSLPHTITEPIIGTIAELHKNKGLDYLIDALGSLTKHPFSLVIIGDGEERAMLEDQAKNIGIGERTHFVGFIPSAAQFLPAFDIFTLPSLKEGLPYVLMEAAHAKIPIVASRVGGIPDIVTENELLADPADTPFLREALATLINDPVRRQHEANMLHTHVNKSFSFETMLDATISLYNSQ